MNPAKKTVTQNCLIGGIRVRTAGQDVTVTQEEIDAGSLTSAVSVTLRRVGGDSMSEDYYRTPLGDVISVACQWNAVMPSTPGEYFYFDAWAKLNPPVYVSAGVYEIELSSPHEDFPRGVAVDVQFVTVQVNDRAAHELYPETGTQLYAVWLSTQLFGDNELHFDSPPPLSFDVTTSPARSTEESIRKLLRRAGIDPADIDTAGTFADVRTLQDAQQIMAGGAIVEQQSYQTVLSALCFNTRCFLDFSGPKVRLIFLPFASEATIQKTATLDDMRCEGDPTPTLAISRSDEDEVVNRYVLRWDRDWSKSRGEESYLSKAAPVRNEGSITALEGVRDDPDGTFWIDWSSYNDDTASRFADWWGPHLAGTPRRISWEAYLNWLEMERGDIVALNIVPIITIGPTPEGGGGIGEGGIGEGGIGGSPGSPGGTIIGEIFEGLDGSEKFIVLQCGVDWDSRRPELIVLELP